MRFTYATEDTAEEYPPVHRRSRTSRNCRLPCRGTHILMDPSAEACCSHPRKKDVLAYVSNIRRKNKPVHGTLSAGAACWTYVQLQLRTTVQDSTMCRVARIHAVLGKKRRKLERSSSPTARKYKTCSCPKNPPFPWGNIHRIVEYAADIDDSGKGSMCKPGTLLCNKAWRTIS